MEFTVTKAGQYVINAFYMPTKVIIGKNCINENAHVFDSLGTRALIVTGRNSSKINGSAKDIYRALDKRNISYVIFDGVENNPSMKDARSAAEQGVKERVDFVIGIGGGSPIDAAKVAAILARNTVSDESVFSN